MKKRVYILPCALAVLVLALAILFICQALLADKLLPFVAHGGRFHKITKTIFGIPHYYFMVLIGAIVACLLAFWRRKQYDLSIVHTIILMVLLSVQAFVGSKLLFALENGFVFDGLSLFGGVFMTVAFVPIVAIILKKEIAKLFDFIAPMGMTLIASVRMGCFMDGCCGAPLRYIGPKAFILPVQLFEVILDLSVLAVLLYLEQNKLTWGEKDKKINLYNGTLALVILASYGTYRFILEFWRATPKNLLGMSNGQVYSLICLALSIIIFLNRKQKHDRALKKQMFHDKKHTKRH